MAFKLNVQGTYRNTTQTVSTTGQLIGGRPPVTARHATGYFESPRMHVMSAALMFLMGLSLASINLSLNSHRAYDMTPTGSIAAKVPAAAPKSCP